MKQTSLLLLISLALFCKASCELFGDNRSSVVEDLTDIPADWIEFDAEGKFTFMGSPDLKKRDDITGIDSFVEAYRGERFHVFFDYGRYSPRVECSPQIEYIACRVTESEIDGRAARVRISTKRLRPSLQSFFGGPIMYSAQMRIDEVAEDRYGKIDLFLAAYSPEVSDTTHLKVLIHSIKISEL